MFNALKKGASASNAVGLKQAQAIINSLAALYAAVVPLANACGLHLTYNPAIANEMTGAILAVANVYVTLATSEKVGL